MTDCEDCELEGTVGEDRRGKKVTRWRGLLAPYGKPTGDKRRFASDALTARELPLPLKWQRTDATGHTTSVVVGDLDGLEFSDEGVYGVGTLFDPDPAVLPRLAEDVAETRLLLDKKVIGPSVDLDDMEFHALGTAEEIEALASQGQRPEIEVTRGRISAATLVPIPAFAEARPFELSLVDPDEPELDEPAAAEDDTSDFALFRRRSKHVDSRGGLKEPHNPGGKNQYGGPYGGGSSSRDDDDDRLPLKGGLADFGDDDGGPSWSRLAQGRTAAQEAFDGLDKREQQSIYDHVHDAAEAVMEEGTDSRVAREIRGALSFINGLGRKHKLKLRDASRIDLDEDDFSLQVDWSDVPIAPVATDWEPDQLDRPALVAGALVYSRQDEAALFPLCAYLDGQLTLVPRAVFMAASILAGQEPTLPANVQARMRGVLSTIMGRMGMSTPWSTPEEQAALVAGAGPLAPPRAWFERQEPDHVTPLTVTEDGQVYGHIASANQPHVGFPGQYVTAPRSATGYAYFHVGVVKTAEGDELPIGKITMGAGHADLRYGYRAAAEHYDNSARAVAIVRATDGRHGIWACGALVPGLSDEQVAELRRSPISGDWREVGGSRELVAALAVNTPGFPIPRAQSRMAGGRELALVAAGVVAPDGWADAPTEEDERIARIVRVTLDQEAVRTRRAASLAASLAGGAEAARQARADRAIAVFGRN